MVLSFPVRFCPVTSFTEYSKTNQKTNRHEKPPELWKFRGFDDFGLRSALAEFLYLFGDRRTLPKTPIKMTEMVLRFPLSFP
jgi:hypothetical protein